MSETMTEFPPPVGSADATPEPPAGDDVPAIENTTGRVATVVFVDDEPAVLEEMRRTTQPWRNVWDVHIAESGTDALGLFAELSLIDVLVTDMHMPGMTVTQLLTEVRQRSPQTARIILSEESDRGSVMQVIGDAHQYLTKPVDVEALAGLIEHVRGAADNDLREPVSKMIGQVDRLPSPPALFQRLSAILASNDWTIDDIADEISQDVALTAEVLKLVNSAFFGTYDEVTSVKRAISLVGIDLIRFIVLGNKLFQANDELEMWLDLDRLDWRSKVVAHGARSLALRDGADSELSATAYLTGIVSEIGLLIMARIPDLAPSIAKPLNTGTYVGAERAIFGGDRFVVGCQLLRLWGFSETIIDAIGRLSSNESHCTGGLPWYLLAARRLVLEQGFDPQDLVVSPGANPEVDEALEQLRQEVDGASSQPEPAT